MILHQTNIPAIYVTHDQEEAFAIADRVLIIHNGEIIREGTPAEVWANPESAFVARFLGLGNIIEGKIVEKMRDGTWKVESRFGVYTVNCEHECQKGDKVYLLVRPLLAEKARVATLAPHDLLSKSSAGESSQRERSRNDANVIQGIVTDMIFQNDRFKVTLDNGLYVYLQETPKLGERIKVRVKVECLA